MEDLRQRYNPDGSSLRKAQLRMVEILKEVDKICRRHNIPYYLEGGTLLGAIRHHGFIPWDDDADIMLTRKEWNELKKHIRPDGFITDAISIKEIVRPELHMANKGIIDIFIMDYAPKNYFLDRLKGLLCMLLCLLLKCKNRIIRHQYNHPKMWFVLIPFAYLFSVNILVKWKDEVSQWFTPKVMHEGDNVRLYNGDPKALQTIHAYGLVSGQKIDVEFEGYKLMSIPQYDAFLRIWYGDYMQLPKFPENLGRAADCDFYDNKVNK